MFKTSKKDKEEKREPIIELDIPTLIQQNGKLHKLIIGEEVTEYPSISSVIGSNGIFILEDNRILTVMRKMDDSNEILDKIEEKSLHAFPKISYVVYVTVLEFLRQVYSKYKSEGNVLLYLNLDSDTPLDKQEYRMYIPKQIVTSHHVDYEIGDDAPKRSEGWMLAGSIHSHPNFAASQSGIDHQDEVNFDGVHYTLGHIERSSPDIHGRLCLAGKVHTLDESKNSMLVTTPDNNIEIPDEWMSKVEEKPVTVTYSNQIGFNNSFDSQKKTFGTTTTITNIIKKIYTIIKPVPTVMKNAKVLDIEKVSKCKILS